eukprot:COSAG04_NODE_27_length_37012_cov_29.502127_16_plen_257_part_00
MPTDSPGTAAEGVEKAKRWALLLVGGAAVQQVGWWSLYTELGLWCGLLGGAAVLVGALGFDRTEGHVDWSDRPYTAEERREENESRRAAGLAELPEGATTGGGLFRFFFWPLLAVYGFCGALATGNSADCPALGTDEGWGERADHGDCGVAAGGSLPNLIFLLGLLVPVRAELVAMRAELVAMGPIYQMNPETVLEQVTTEQADATDRTARDAEARRPKKQRAKKKKKKPEPVQTTSNPMTDSTMDFMDSSSEGED